VKKRIVKISNLLRVGKDGKNDFAKYDYFKPDDVLKNLNPLLEEHNLITIFNLKNEGDFYKAVLTVEDTESDQKVEYVFDICKATVKGANEAQNSGATMTYAKRYSLMNAFNIADNEADFDSKKPDTSKQSKPNEKITTVSKITTEQAKRLFAIAKGNETLVRTLLEKYGFKSTKDIPAADYKTICEEVEFEVKKAS